jgi:CDP-2,3-bis-(O-geranylgeranyl)-sn-glycerol synthase
MRDSVLHLLQLAYFMAPAYLANMAPPFLRFWKGWNRPIHLRLLGSHKTVLGFVLGVATGVAAAGLQAVLALPHALATYTGGAWLWLGLALGAGAMAGDALKSLLKRRLGIAPGRPWPPLDQIDFALGALALAGPSAGIGMLDVLAILAFTFIGDVLANRLSFRLHLKDVPW